ncbi:MAG: cytochrome c [Myxococcota bacterium]|nr:cytochrome c [Myxococcota bacterium]
MALSWTLAMAACGGDDDKGPATDPETGERAAPQIPTPVPTPAPVPEAAPARNDPALGSAIYANYCATCHGARGGGDGPLSNNLPVRPANHSDGSYMNGLSDAYLTQVITEGGLAVGKDAMMAPWGDTLSAEEIAHVVAYVRTLADPPYVAPTGD